MGIASMTAPILFTHAFSAAVGPYRDLNVPGVPFLIAAFLPVLALLVVRTVAATPRPAAAAAEVE